MVHTVTEKKHGASSTTEILREKVISHSIPSTVVYCE